MLYSFYFASFCSIRIYLNTKFVVVVVVVLACFHFIFTNTNIFCVMMLDF